MRSRFVLPILLLSSLLLTPLGHLAAQEKIATGVTTSRPAAADSVAKLKSSLDGLLQDKKLEGTRIGIHIVDVQSGQELYAHDADELYNPASNAKLITSAAALDVLGPQHTFTTRVLAEKVDGEKVPGAVYVTGDGEGFLLREDMLDWAAEIRARGITEISGDIIVDDGPFKGGDFLPPGFDQKDEDASYRAPVGAVSVNFNAVTVHVSPGKVGEPARITLDPPNDHVVIDNQLTTVAGKARRFNAASISTDEGKGTTIQVKGTVGADATAWSTRKRIDNPPLFAGSVFKASLEALGVKVKGKVRRGAAPSGGVSLVTHASEPLVYLLMAMNKWSNNFMAEQVFRDLGTTSAAGDARGTWDGGRKVLQDFLKKAAPPVQKSNILNGSGLYTGNRYSARQISSVLRYMHHHTWGPEYKSTLAISGVDGTLGRRLRGESTKGKIRAKTGTLNQVSALAGYMITASGREVAFVILFNDPPVRAWRLRPEQDAIATAIAEWEG